MVSGTFETQTDSYYWKEEKMSLLSLKGLNKKLALNFFRERIPTRNGYGDALIELNEAYAAQSIAVMNELGIDEKKLNVNGGAIALGHPIGATGARILTTLIHTLHKRKKDLGLATLCIGGGESVSMSVKRI